MSNEPCRRSRLPSEAEDKPSASLSSVSGDGGAVGYHEP
jgi:hypothetical protein